MAFGTEVRARLASDTRAVRRVARAAWRATYGPIAPPGFIGLVLRRGYARERLVEGLVDRRRDALVAWRDGRVVGYADLYETAPGRCELRRLYVDPPAQAAGVGRALLGAAVDAAARRGASRVDVAVDRANASAVSWYERRGFVRCGASAFEAGGWSRPQVLLALDLAVSSRA
jgi:ribosomal protein S18 acetylase RimI-like enzyme